MACTKRTAGGKSFSASRGCALIVQPCTGTPQALLLLVPLYMRIALAMPMHEWKFQVHVCYGMPPFGDIHVSTVLLTCGPSPDQVALRIPPGHCSELQLICDKPIVLIQHTGSRTQGQASRPSGPGRTRDHMRLCRLATRRLQDMAYTTAIHAHQPKGTIAATKVQVTQPDQLVPPP
jgi:hypothetical protein